MAEGLGEVFVLPKSSISIVNDTGVSDTAIEKVRDALGMCPAIKNEHVIAVAVEVREPTREHIEGLLKGVLDYGDYMQEKRLFKVNAPWSDYPLNDKQIDGVMAQFAERFEKFYHYKFCMGNFMNDEAVIQVTGHKSSLAEKSIINIYKEGYRRWGCVLNTDYYGGGGKHWVCLYGEMIDRVWTIEYFNSSSRAPFEDVRRWIEVQEGALMALAREDPKFSDIILRTVTNPNDYQRGEGHHCGVYSLIYIWQRLNGVPADKYLRKKISNSHVLAFRKYIFHDPTAVSSAT
jgi:hypothetical protein